MFYFLQFFQIPVWYLDYVSETQWPQLWNLLWAAGRAKAISVLFFTSFWELCLQYLLEDTKSQLPFVLFEFSLLIILLLLSNKLCFRCLLYITREYFFFIIVYLCFNFCAINNQVHYRLFIIRYHDSPNRRQLVRWATRTQVRNKAIPFLYLLHYCMYVVFCFWCIWTTYDITLK